MTSHLLRLALATASLFAGASAAAIPSVLTYHNDGARSGANLQETVLNTGNVNAATFGKLFSRPVDDQIYSQLLYMPGVNIPGRSTHNVIFAATVNDTLYAFDADYPAMDLPLWKTSFLSSGVTPVAASDLSAKGACGGSYHDFAGNMGIVGTPVIDPAPFPGAPAGDQGTIYAVARTKEGGSYVQRLHALSVQTGLERQGSPVTIQYTGRIQNTALTFDPIIQNQRPGLALVNGVVYIGWASHCDFGSPYHGWLMGYDAHSLQQTGVFCSTPSGSNGGIWMGGSPPSFDDQGNLYLSTGNGTVSASATNPANRGESFLKLTPAAGALNIASYFTPYNYAQLEAGDIDLGSAGLLLFPGASGKNLAIGAGKQGRLYVVDRDNMGGVQTGSDSQIVQSIDVNLNNKVMGGPVYWQGPDGVKRFYIWAANSPLKAYTYNGATFNTTPATSTMTASNPGAMLSLSANGSQAGTGIVWAMCPTADANQQTVVGILRALNAEDPSQELWNSTTNAGRDAIGSYAKFNQPTIANGNVYVPTFSKQLLVYGRLSNAPSPAAPVQLAATAPSKILVHLEWSAPADSSRTGFIVERSTDGVNFDQIMNLAADAVSYDDTTVMRFTHYVYRIKAYNLNGSAISPTADVSTATGAPEAEIAISGAGHDIAAGSGFISADTGTDFGQFLLGSGSSAVHTFTVRNDGNAPLNLSGSPAITVSGPGAGDFSLTPPPAGAIPPQGSVTFSIVFTPQAEGQRDATVTLLNDDPHGSPFSFAITGRGTRQDLVALWHFDEPSGTLSSVDATGRGHTGIPTTGPYGPFFGSAGHFDTAAFYNSSFGNAVQPYVAVADAADLDPADGLTISCWILWQGLRSGFVQPLVQKGISNNQYRLSIVESTLKVDFGQVGSLSTPLTRNGWTHIAATYDGNTMRLYLRGTQVASTSSSGRIPATTDPLYIGGQPGAGDHFFGSLDDLRLYGRALSVAEVQKLAAQSVAVSVSAPVALAQKKGASGQFEFTAPFKPGDLNVNFEIVSGPGQAVYRTDYGMSIIPPVAAIPVNSSILDVVVTPLSFNTVTGPLDVTLRVLEGDGYAVGKNDTATVHLLDSGYNQWRIDQFGGIEQAKQPSAAEDASPAGDGVSNLMKYALGLAPMTPAQPVTTYSTESWFDGDHPVLSFTAPSPLPTDLRYVPEWQMGDLSGEWQPLDMNPDSDGEVNIFRAVCPLPLTEGIPFFMRLRLEEH